MVFLVFWAYCGYLITLSILIIIGEKSKTNQYITEYPFISILVPCFNEASLIKEKIENIKQLDYPKDKLEVIFCDGKSTDETFRILKEETEHLDYIEVVQSDIGGKINQINYVLQKARSEIIVSTDTDCILKRDAIIEIVKVFQSDKEIAVVGAYVIPKNALALEVKYWSDQNKIRILESRVHSCSIVIAPCFAFKRGLMDGFPKDCIADDIYISFYGNIKGKKVKYAEKVIVYETRNPNTIMALLRHKFRKGNAYIIELLRVFYKLPYMHPIWRFTFLTKLLQVIVIPWILPFFLISSVSMALSGRGPLNIVMYSAVFLFISFIITHFLIRGGRKVQVEEDSKGMHFSFTLFLVINAILLLNGITFPFFRQTSNYTKIENK